MTIMWLCTTGCIKLMVPKLTLLTAMVSFQNHILSTL
jgi:hypothetical protein